MGEIFLNDVLVEIVRNVRFDYGLYVYLFVIFYLDIMKLLIFFND